MSETLVPEEVVVTVDSDDFDGCSKCGRLAEWVGFWTCGHARPYCAAHALIMQINGEYGRIHCRDDVNLTIRMIRRERM